MWSCLKILQDSEQQMILTARRSLVSKMSRNQAPRFEIFFFNINVRRSHLVNDSLNEVRWSSSSFVWNDFVDESLTQLNVIPPKQIGASREWRLIGWVSEEIRSHKSFEHSFEIGSHILLNLPILIGLRISCMSQARSSTLNDTSRSPNSLH